MGNDKGKDFPGAGTPGNVYSREEIEDLLRAVGDSSGAIDVVVKFHKAESKSSQSSSRFTTVMPEEYGQGSHAQREALARLQAVEPRLHSVNLTLE